MMRYLTVPFVIVISFFPNVVLGQSCVTPQVPPGTNTGPSIIVNNTNFPDDTVLLAGAADWNATSCGNNGYAFPSITFGSQPSGNSRFVTLVYDAGPAAGGVCGSFNGTTITLYGLSTLSDGRVVSCGDATTLKQNFEHELGHTLGLADSSCSGYIMYGIQIDSAGNYNSRSLQPDECSAVDTEYVTPSETPPPPPPVDQCTHDDTDPCSPIVINFAKGDYSLTGVDAPVWFDIAGVGTPALIGWTAAAADEAFLWLDRNGDGMLNNGAELFGTATRLRTGQRAPNGFEALREFDDNGDGVIDEHDAIWPRLMLWRDLNHDGISGSDEIMPLAGSGVVAIELNYHWAGRHDPYGNTYRYESHLWLDGPGGNAHANPVYDIFFVPASP